MQQINLYVEELRPKKDWLSAKYLSVGLVGCTILFVFFHFLKYHENNKLEVELEEKKLVLKALELELDKSKSTSQPSSREEIEKTISLLQKKIHSRERLVGLIEGQTIDENFSFNTAMKVMAEYGSSHIAVQQFTFSWGGKFVEVRGEALHSYDAPRYLDDLRKAAEFSRSKFGLVSIDDKEGTGEILFTMGYDGSSSFSNDVVAEE